MKQASRQWFSKFSTTLVSHLGFQQSKFDYSLFTRKTKATFIALLVYVDDIFIASDNKAAVEELKVMLDQEFKLKDLGELKYFLGLEVARFAQGINLCQRKYTLELLSDTGMLGSKPVKTPMEQNLRLSKYEGQKLEDLCSYRRLIGKLLYLIITRPNITYAIHR